jgi:hypothetical protein
MSDEGDELVLDRVEVVRLADMLGLLIQGQHVGQGSATAIPVHDTCLHRIRPAAVARSRVVKKLVPGEHLAASMRRLPRIVTSED